MNLGPRDARSLDAARLYYERGMSQGEVAQRLGVSRPTVSKLIQHARDRGYVTVEIHDPRSVPADVAEELRDRYGLELARVLPSQHGEAELLRELGRAGASVLEDLVADGDLLGITWGRTMNAVARSLTRRDRRGVQVVPLKGGPCLTSRSASPHETVRLFCEAFGAYPRLLPLPVMFDDPQVKLVVERDRHIKQILDLGRDAQTAIFTVGALSPDAALLRWGYVSDAEWAAVLDKAVGEICSRFIDERGNAALPDLDARTVAVSLAGLRAKATRICVAGGLPKARPLRTALASGYVSHLVTDEATARAVLGGVPS